MPVSQDHAGPSGRSRYRASVLPSVTGTTSAPQDEGTCAAQWLAYALPCQRFANTLTGTCALISGSMRFATSFIVGWTCTIYSLPVSRRTPFYLWKRTSRAQPA